ncbi:MAG: OprD family outer membrane porin [Sulfurimonas sp.]|nr:OprD family outer membrane porin [Sulfurimonas sp.]
MAVTALHAGTDGVNTKLNHGVDAKVIAKSVKSVDDLSSMFSEGKTSGQIRMFYLNREYQGGAFQGATIAAHRDVTTLGGHLKFETAKLNGFNMAMAFYTVQDLGIEAEKLKEPAMLGSGNKSYSILGEAYLGYDFDALGSKTKAKIGYQRYNSPMMGSDDVRTIPTTFRAYKFVNKDIAGTTIQIAHVDSIAYGTFGNVYLSNNDGTRKNGGLLAATSGYSAVESTIGEYHNMGVAAVGRTTAGVTNIGVKYKAKNFHVKVSNDYAWDLYNTLYVDAGVSWNCMLNKDVKPFLKGQVIKQNSVGGEYMKNVATPLGYSDAGSIDSLFVALKVGVKYAGLTAYVAYSQTGANTATEKANNPFQNAIVTQFGGTPSFTQGMVMRHQFLAGTKATKVAASYNFKEHGVNLSTAAYYVSYDMDANSGYGVARTATEPGFDIKYYPASVKKLQLRFRGNYPRKFAESTPGNDVGWDEYRLIANYNF